MDYEKLLSEKAQISINALLTLFIAVLFPLIVLGVIDDVNITDIFRKPVFTLFGISTVIGAILTKMSAINLGFYNATKKEYMVNAINEFNTIKAGIVDYNALQDELNLYNENTIKGLQNEKYNILKRKYEYKKNTMFTFKIKIYKRVLLQRTNERYIKKLEHLEKNKNDNSIKIYYKEITIKDLVSLNETNNKNKLVHFRPKKHTMKRGIITLLFIHFVLLTITTGSINGDIDGWRIFGGGIIYLVTTCINYTWTYMSIFRETLTNYYDSINFKKSLITQILNINEVKYIKIDEEVE